MIDSIREFLRRVAGNEKKEKSVFRSEREAYDFCRKLYRESGGVTPELQRSFEFYLKNFHADDCDPNPEFSRNIHKAS
jgi:hypothetical protein